jgi:hypothetical protein
MKSAATSDLFSRVEIYTSGIVSGRIGVLVNVGSGLLEGLTFEEEEETDNSTKKQQRGEKGERNTSEQWQQREERINTYNLKRHWNEINVTEGLWLKLCWIELYFVLLTWMKKYKINLL